EVDLHSLELLSSKVRALLNGLTMESFDSISDQIVVCANMFKDEHDCRSLSKIVRLVYDTATNDLTSSAMYALLCRRMMGKISPGVRDEAVRDAEGKSIAGGQLFHRLLLNRCKKHFERCWAAR
ncbi:armadillo-type protein, partial [Fomitopsis serialis]|uniref:armadillo-type protein n=1 Tax=Fomitopsis serialis TaxID=139415 RepID=UPI002007D97D